MLRRSVESFVAALCTWLMSFIRRWRAVCNTMFIRILLIRGLWYSFFVMIYENRYSALSIYFVFVKLANDTLYLAREAECKCKKMILHLQLLCCEHHRVIYDHDMSRVYSIYNDYHNGTVCCCNGRHPEVFMQLSTPPYFNTNALYSCHIHIYHWKVTDRGIILFHALHLGIYWHWRSVLMSLLIISVLHYVRRLAISVYFRDYVKHNGWQGFSLCESHIQCLRIGWYWQGLRVKLICSEYVIVPIWQRVHLPSRRSLLIWCE